MTNPYCDPPGIEPPSLERVKDHREANTYALLIVALLESGRPMTLAQVAERFAAAGIAPAERALLSLRRCQPARAPVYRDGDEYALDPYDHELGLWAFRLGLEPPWVPKLEVVRPAPAPIGEPHQALTAEELDEGWRETYLGNWSAQRLALAVLDAHGGPMTPEQAVRSVGRRSREHRLRPEAAKYWRSGAVRVREDGRWELGENRAALLGARKAVRERIEMNRRWAGRRPDPAIIKASTRASERRRAAHADELAALRRVLLHVFPAKAPEAVVLLEIGERRIETLFADEFPEARRRIGSYDWIGAVDVRAVLRTLGVEASGKRLAELGPPQKTKTLNRRGRTLKITNTLLIRGSCRISRPFGDPKKLESYLRTGQTTRLRRRLEADAKSLFALYQYGRLHGAVRLVWGFLDDMIPVPWVHFDEPTLGTLERQALEEGRALEVVVGAAPGWADPWSRAQRCSVVRRGEWRTALVDAEGVEVWPEEVQAARLA